MVSEATFEAASALERREGVVSVAVAQVRQWVRTARNKELIRVQTLKDSRLLWKRPSIRSMDLP